MIDPTRLDQPLSDRQLDTLDAFLTERCMPYGGMPLSMLDGYLTAIVSCREVVLPNAWLPAVWEAPAADFSGRDDGFAFASSEEAQLQSVLVMRLMNEIARNFIAGEIDPIFAAGATEDGARIELANIWCAGYVAGIGLNRDAWEPLLTNPETNVHFGPIFVLAEPLLNDDDETEDADAMRAILAIPDRDELMKAVPQSAFAIYQCSRDLRAPVPTRRSGTPGRNAPCPCGSGRKYKKCCGAA